MAVFTALAFRRRSRKDMRNTFSVLSENFCAYVNILGLPVLLTLVLWAVSVDIFGNATITSGTASNSSTITQGYALVTALLIILAVFFVIVQIIMYRDPNPYSSSVFNTRTPYLGLMKLALKFLLILDTMMIKDKGSKFRIWLLATTIYGLIFWINCTVIDFSRVWAQTALACIDSTVLTITLTSASDYIIGQRSDKLYSFIVTVLIAGFLIFLKFKTRARAFRVKKSVTSKMFMHSESAFDHLLDLLSIIQVGNLASKKILSLYLEKEIYELSNLSGSTPIFAKNFSISEDNVGQTTINKITDTEGSQTSNMIINDVLVNLFTSYIILLDKINSLDKNSIILLIYTLLKGRFPMKYCLSYHKKLKGMNDKQMSFQALLAYSWISQDINNILEEWHNSNINYFRSDISEFITSDTIFKKLNRLIAKNRILLEQFWYNFLEYIPNADLSLKLRSEIYATDRKINKEYAKSKNVGNNDHDFDKVYLKYLKYVVFSPETNIRIELLNKRAMNPLLLDIEELPLAFDLLNRSNKKQLVFISAEKDKVGIIRETSADFPDIIGIPGESLKGRNFFEYLVHNSNDTFMSDVKEIIDQYNEKNNTSKKERLLVVNIGGRSIKLMAYNLHLINGPNSEVMIMICVWPIKLSPPTQNVLVIYDSISSEIRHVTENAKVICGIDDKQSLNDGHNTSCNEKIREIWAELEDPQLLESLNNGHRLKLRMVTRSVSKTSFVGSRLNFSDNTNLMRVTKYTFVQMIKLRCFDSTNLRVLRVSLVDKSSELDENPEISALKSTSKMDDEVGTSNDLNIENNNFLNNLRKLDSKLKNRYLIILKVLINVSIVAVSILVILSFIYFNNTVKLINDKMSLIDIVSSTIDGITSRTLYMFQIILTNKGKLFDMSYRFSTQQLPGVFESFQNSEAKRQQLYVNNIIESSSKLSIESLSFQSVETTNEILNDGLDGDINLGLVDGIDFYSSQYIGVNIYMKSLDNFMLNPTDGTYLINKRVLFSINNNLSDNFTKIINTFEEQLHMRGNNYNNYMIGIYLTAFILVVGTLVILALFIRRIISLYSTLALLSPLQINRYLNIMSSQTDSKLAEELRHNIPPYLKWKDHTTVDLKSNLSIESIEVSNSVEQDFKQRIKMRKMFIKGQRSPFKNIVFYFILFVLICVGLYARQSSYSKNMFSRFEQRIKLLNTLSLLKVNLVKLNLSFFYAILDDSCTPSCMADAESIYNEIQKNSLQVDNVILSITQQGVETYFSNVRLLYNNVCQFYLDNISNIRSICDSNPLLYYGYSVVLAKVLYNYKSYLYRIGDPELDKLQGYNAFIIFLVRQSIITLMNQGMVEKDEFLATSLKSQKIQLSIFFLLLLSVSCFSLYMSSSYIRRQLAEVKLFLNFMNTDVVKESTALKEYVDKLIK